MINKMRTLIFAGSLMACAASLSAQDLESKTYSADYGFQQERMIIDDGEIFVVSSFDAEDHITVYNIFGTRFWDTKFYSKILSWKVSGDYVIVFSKSRIGNKTFLTCLDRLTGAVFWERP